MLEEEKSNMDKKGNSRQCVQKTTGNDCRKDVSTRNQHSGTRRGNFSAGVANYSYNDGPSRKQTPQKYRNTWDKRPKQRGELTTGSGGDLEDEDLRVEYGSAIQAGSKKGNLNHLLNFTYEHEVNTKGYRGEGYGGGAHWGRGKQVRYRGSKAFYNKEQFLQANCQFVVKDVGDYSVHLMDPDVLVGWDKVEQVRVTGTEPPSCPICLQYPIAAKMTRCGHIYCWSCILHYLAVGEKTWRKCPICYESVHSDDLKSVVCREVDNYKIGDRITLTLMKKEKGSIYAVPANHWHKQPGKCHNIRENDEITRHVKLLTAQPGQVLEVTELEKQQLFMQLLDAESSEEPFIKGAQDQVNTRELLLLGISDVQKDRQEAVDKAEKNTEPPADIPTVKQSIGAQKIKQYKCAFSNDEAETVSTEPVSSDHVECSTQDKSDSPTPGATDGKSSPLIPGSTSLMKDSLPVGSPESRASPIEMMSGIMPVEEVAENLDLPTQQNEKARHKSGDSAFYFYQADDGQHIYLHSLNARCLVREYGSLEHCPQKLTASIVEKESVFVTEELRKRLRYLSHLPLTCAFEVVELAIKPPVVGKDTLKHFADDIDKRRRLRQRRAKDDKRTARMIEEQERKNLGLGTGTIVHSQFQPQQSTMSSNRHSDTRSDTSSPSLDTPVGSPQGLDVNAADFQPCTSPGDVDAGSQTATVSFAQMLKAGAKSTVWPKMKSDNSVSPLSPSSARAGSDESDNEDKIPVPKFQSSFGSAIEAAFESIAKTTDATSLHASGGNNPTTSGSGKKKKKQLVLFSTSMARGGK